MIQTPHEIPIRQPKAAPHDMPFMHHLASTSRKLSAQAERPVSNR
ncbi:MULTISPECIES: hypothetical protein [unclassified Bradyrhizobium]|nr:MULTISPECIES: hypothetical protein [unclassified Bradyrhizobium]